MKKLFKIDSKWKEYAAALCTAVLLYVLLIRIEALGTIITKILRIISPVFTGLVIAYILNPLVKFIEQRLFANMKNRKASWIISMILAFVFILLLVSLFVAFVAPEIINSVSVFISNLDHYSRTVNEYINSLNEWAAEHNMDLSTVTDPGRSLVDRAFSLILKHQWNMLSTVADLGAGIVSGVLSAILSIYFLLDKKRLQASFSSFTRLFMSDKRHASAGNFWSSCNVVLVHFIYCELIDAVIVGVANAIFMVITGMPYVALISMVVAVTNLIPNFGPVIGAIIGGLILLLVNPWQTLLFVLFTIVLQAIDGYVIKPKLFGDILNVPGIWILIAIIVGSRVAGLAGMILGIPCAAISNIFYRDYLHHKLEENKAIIEAAAAKKQEDSESENQ